LKKSPQAIENKGNGREKERQGRKRSGKLLTTKELREKAPDKEH
jgi:hypothetical protein